MGPRTLAELIAGAREFSLEESAAVVNVLPMLTLDPLGGFLVADEAEGQFRRYSAQGRLLWSRGRKGGGPGEFEALVKALRLRDGRVLAVDRSGILTLFDSTATGVIRTYPTEIRHVSDAHVLDDSRLLVAGIRGEPDGPRLHVFDLRRDSITASFFSPFRRSASPAASTVAGWSEVAARGDTIAAVFATSDTVYLMDLTGAEVGRLPLPSAHFRRVTGAGPETTADAGWLETFDLVEDIHWLSDGSLLVASQSLDASRGIMNLTRRHHLVGMSRGGRLLFEIRDMPDLLGVDPRTDSLYFVHPEAEAPNRWLVTHLDP